MKMLFLRMSYSKTKIATATRIIADKILNNDFVM